MGVVLLAAFVPSAAAVEYTVNSNPYTVNHTLLATEAWNAYELTANTGDRVTYSMTVTSAGDCAMLLLVQGHNPTVSSQYYTSYSQDTCSLTYSNTFQVPSGEGNQFSIVIATDQLNDISYTLTIAIALSPGLSSSTLLLIVGIVVAVVVVIIAVAVVASRKKKAAAIPPAMPPPYMGPTQPGYPAAHPPPAYPPQYPPQQPPPYPPPPPGP